MATLDIVISRDKMLVLLANYKLKKTTMEQIFEKEDFWKVFEPKNTKEGGSSTLSVQWEKDLEPQITQCLLDKKTTPQYITKF